MIQQSISSLFSTFCLIIVISVIISILKVISNALVSINNILQLNKNIQKSNSLTIIKKGDSFKVITYKITHNDNFTYNINITCKLDSVIFEADKKQCLYNATYNFEHAGHLIFQGYCEAKWEEN